MKHDFKFISNHSPQVKSTYSDLMEILSLVHDDLRKQYTFQHKPVGSYSRNMITHDAKSNIGFDFDINIYPNDEENRFTAKQIKLLFKQSLDKFAYRYFCNPEGVNGFMDTKIDNQTWEKLTYAEKNHQLFLREKELLAGFLAHGAISQAQHDKSLHDLIEKMGEKE